MDEVTENETVEILDRDKIVRLRQDVQRFQKRLVAFRDEIERGEGVDAPAVRAEVGRLLGLLKTCEDMENRLEKARQEKFGVSANGHAIDLDAARASIGCKLNRLRACCQAD